MNASHRDVYPDDVRKSPGRFGKTPVAWAGVVETIKETPTPSNTIFTFTLTHHYFDWIEDSSVQRARFFLSPRGEGQFRASWAIRKGADLDVIRQAGKPGNMLVVYGTPQAVDHGIVDLKTEYIRPFSAEDFTTRTLDYGRDR